MELTKVEKTVDSDHIEYDPNRPQYPYGTELRFDEDLIASLGIENLNVGDEVTVMGVAKVTSKSENSHESEGQTAHTDKHIEIQLIEVAVNSTQDTPDRADQLYPQG